MTPESENNLRLEIGHVLFIDLVGYSKLLIEEQRERLGQLTEIVLATGQVAKASNEQLVRLPTGDGMALVFRNSSEEPARCALEIAEALRKHPENPVRMGIHSGPVSEVIDVSGRTNIAGAGINMAQRVMDCGDAGHILLSQRVAEDLAQYRQWAPRLHDLGECEVKHGVRLHLVNLYAEQLGNPALPLKFQQEREKEQSAVAAPSPGRSRLLLIVLSILIFSLSCLAIVALIFAPAVMKSISRQRTAAVPPPISSATPAAVPEKSIAVLPFENLSRDPNNAYFATGIQDEILTRLARIGALKVISRSSTQRFAARPENLSEIGYRLSVANVLEGSVQKVDGQVHVNVQLIRAATDEHLWAESYDRNLENVFGVEREVATAVAEALKATLTGAEQHALEQQPTNNPAAYDAYLRGVALYRDDNVNTRLKALQPLEEAVHLDSHFALAWAFLVRVNLFLEDPGSATERHAAAQRSLDTALRLEPDLPEVRLAEALYQAWALENYVDARRILEQLRPKLPNSADVPEELGRIAEIEGRWNDSRANIEEAIALNPLDRSLRMKAALVREAVRDFPAALRCYDQALSIWPDDATLIAGKARVYQKLGELNQADALLRKLRPTIQNDVIVGTFIYQAVLRRQYSSAITFLQNGLGKADSLPPIWRAFYRQALGDLQRLSGDEAAAQTSYSEARGEFERRLGEQPENTEFFTYTLSSIYAGLGDCERALKYAKDAKSEEGLARVAARCGQKQIAISTLERLLKVPQSDPITPALLRLDPDFDSLRSDPRFQELCEEKQH